MSRYYITYAYFKLDEKGRPKSKTSTSGTFQTSSESIAVQMVHQRHPGYQIELRKVEERK